MIEVRIEATAFDAGAELNRFTGAQTGAGAIVSFTGITRDLADDPLNRMEIEHYPAMTERAVTEFTTQARTRFTLSGALVIHRYGTLKPNDAIMMVATAAPHRKSAFDAADFLMDYLKSRAPFWKKEVTISGETWVAAKDHDEDALARWTTR